jgi:hypothetical protein
VIEHHRRACLQNYTSATYLESFYYDIGANDALANEGEVVGCIEVCHYGALAAIAAMEIGSVRI